MDAIFNKNIKQIESNNATGMAPITRGQTCQTPIILAATLDWPAAYLMSDWIDKSIGTQTFAIEYVP